VIEKLREELNAMAIQKKSIRRLRSPPFTGKYGVEIQGKRNGEECLGRRSSSYILMKEFCIAF